MSYPSAFLDAVLDAPEDDAPRLVYADWLDEHGDHDRAEFIRVQVERVRLPEGDGRHDELERHEEDLLAEHEQRWVGPAADFLVCWGFRRGLVEEIEAHA